MQLIPPSMAKYGYVFTLNNPSPANISKLQDAIGRCGIKFMVFGHEVAPTTGTPHLQGYFQTNQKNLKRFYEMFNIHVKPQIATATQAAEYCRKDGNSEEFGVFDSEIKGTKEKKQGARTDIDAIMADIDAGMDYMTVTRTHAKTASRITSFIREQISHRDTMKSLASFRERFAALSLYPWQRELLAVLEVPPDERKITWIWSSAGKTGKSTMATFLGAMKEACVLESAKKQDLAYIFAQKPAKIVVFDLSRTLAPEDDGKSKLDHLYAFAEGLKNSRIVSTKYQSASIVFACPHVVFFANFGPDMSKWSEDRYDVREITAADCA